MVMGDEMPIKLGFKDVIFVMEDVDAASKIVQRRDGKTGVVARVEHRLPSLSPEEAALLVGGAVPTPWRLLLGSDDTDVKELVDSLMAKSDRLKAAAISPDNIRAAAAGLRVPKPPTPSTDKERAELEKKSPAERAVDAAQMVQQLIAQQCERKEQTDNFVRGHAVALRRILMAGGVVDAALEDELLGVTPPPPELTVPKRGASKQLGYDGGAVAGGEEEEEEEDGMDLQMMKAMMSSMEDGGGGGKSGKGAMVGPSAGGSSAYALKRDKLNLSGLLNVLDGVVDTPERIVVMTTNHPEILDPALIRPGRIDQKLLLGYMKWGSVVQMIAHYFQLGDAGLDEALTHRIREAILGNDSKVPALNLTPAQVSPLVSGVPLFLSLTFSLPVSLLTFFPTVGPGGAAVGRT